MCILTWASTIHSASPSNQGSTYAASPEKCAQFCESQGWPLAGVEYGGEVSLRSARSSESIVEYPPLLTQLFVVSSFLTVLLRY
jgi:hypothetical protein